MYNVNTSRIRNQLIPIGYRGEDDARTVTFPQFGNYKEFGYPAQIVVTHQRPGDQLPYVVAKVDYPEAPGDGEELTAFDVVWTISNTDVARAGMGEVQVSYYYTAPDGSGNCRTSVYKTLISPSLGNPGPAPEPYTEDFIAQVAAIYAHLDEILKAASWQAGDGIDITDNVISVSYGDAETEEF